MGSALETIDKMMHDMRHDGRVADYTDIQILRNAIAREAVVWPRPSELHSLYKAGRAARLSGATCPHPPSSAAETLHSYGWIIEDLRQALMLADPDGYGKSQRAIEDGRQTLHPNATLRERDDWAARAWRELAGLFIRIPVAETIETMNTSETGVDAIMRITREGLAARATLKSLGYTYEGGEQWKPPIGRTPVFPDDTKGELTKPGWDVMLGAWRAMSPTRQWQHFELMRQVAEGWRSHAIFRIATDETGETDDDKTEWTATAAIRPGELTEFTGTISGLTGGDLDVTLVAAPGVDLRQVIGDGIELFPEPETIEVRSGLELVLADRLSDTDVPGCEAATSHEPILAPAAAQNWEVDRQLSQQEMVIACLGDDAAQIRELVEEQRYPAADNPVCEEWADNMDAAAKLLAYEPLSKIEVRHLTTMLHGAPCEQLEIEHIHALLELYEKVRGMNKRPVDIATMPPGYWDDEPGRPQMASPKFPFPTNIVIQPEAGVA